MQRIVSLLFVSLSLSALLFIVTPQFASAACTSSGNSSIDQVKTGVGIIGADCSGAKAEGTIPKIISLLAYGLGIVAIIMILVGGFLYVTSGGDGGRVKSAKNTIIFALIGLVVAATAQAIVTFVLTKSAGG